MFASNLHTNSRDCRSRSLASKTIHPQYMPRICTYICIRSCMLLIYLWRSANRVLYSALQHLVCSTYTLVEIKIVYTTLANRAKLQNVFGRKSGVVCEATVASRFLHGACVVHSAYEQCISLCLREQYLSLFDWILTALFPFVPWPLDLRLDGVSCARNSLAICSRHFEPCVLVCHIRTVRSLLRLSHIFFVRFRSRCTEYGVHYMRK